MSAKFFLCYRQDDSLDFALQVREKLQAEFGDHAQFVSFDSILAGASFDVAVRQEVMSCQALLVLVGPNWSNALFDDGVPRARLPQDGVRTAIATALAQDMPVLPILLGENARVPNPDSLSDDIKAMAFRNALSLSRERLELSLEHVCKLVEGIGLSTLGRPLRRKVAEVDARPGGKCVFISYRRDDAGPSARTIFTRFGQRFGRRNVFMDVDSLEPGRDFPSLLNDYLAQSAVVAALIGPDWLNAELNGQRRLEDPDDFVRLELATALRRDKPVIPVVLGAASLPRPSELPSELKALPLRHAIFIADPTSHAELTRLERAVGGYIEPQRRWWRFF